MAAELVFGVFQLRVLYAGIDFGLAIKLIISFVESVVNDAYIYIIVL
jgi:hypothetical protein